MSTEEQNGGGQKSLDDRQGEESQTGETSERETTATESGNESKSVEKRVEKPKRNRSSHMSLITMRSSINSLLPKRELQVGSIVYKTFRY